jgi:pyruvate-ferredoxin/flavodoxin oxidoreductase
MVAHKLSKGKYQYALAVSPLDCMGCSVCVGVCPTKSLKMVGQESQLAEQKVFDYMVKEVSVKPDVAGTDNVVKSQYLKPYLEFSGSCAGCAETSYARLVTQLFGPRMYVSNATGCSSIWGGPAATSPYCKDKNGKGVAWANSLFEDNAENGFGIYLGQKVLREKYIEAVKDLIAVPYVDEDIAAAGKEFLDTVDDGEKNTPAAEKLIAAINAVKAVSDGCDCEACTLARKVLEGKDYLNKKSVWIFGGDGWAFDIGFGGLDHVLASGEDVNVFVFNTEVYSNTGGQASKASNIGQVAQFAAAGKEIKSKSLAEIAMTYGYVYVAQVAMGANMAQTLKAIKEAEAWHGPSLIIGYSPCEMHSIKGGMANCQAEMKKAVDCGYWNLFRYNPAAEKPFTLDSKDPKEGYQDFLKNEARYARLAASNPERAADLFAKNEANAMERYEHLKKLKALYE